jgi:uncharacterized protein (UPF0333 family)
MEIKKSKKGQAALDFMMTYGWAIVLVVIIAVAMFAMGIFDPSNFIGNKAAGFAGVSVVGWSMDTAGTFTIKAANNVGNPIQLDSINVTIGGASVNVPVSNATIAVGENSALLSSATGAFGAQAAGSGYTAKVSIRYIDTNAGFPYVSSGTLTAKVS